jgi:hypothetical protein
MVRIRICMQHVAVVVASSRICFWLESIGTAAQHRQAPGRKAINCTYEVENIINLTSSGPTLTIIDMRRPVIGLVWVVGRITGRVLIRCARE